MKVSIEEIEAVLRSNAVAPSTIVKIVTELEAAAEDAAPERDTGPKQKNKFVVVANDKDSAWVVQVAEDIDAGTIQSRLSAAAKTFNASKKGRKHPIKSWTDLFAALPRKFTKEPAVSVLIKSKDLVRVITPTNNP